MTRSRWTNIAERHDLCFVTTAIEEFIPVFSIRECAQIILSNLDFYRQRDGFLLHAYVVMLDHIHFLLHLTGQTDLRRLMADFKRYTAKQILQSLQTPSTGESSLKPLPVDVSRLNGKPAAKHNLSVQVPYLDGVPATTHDLSVQVPYLDEPSDEEKQHWLQTFARRGAADGERYSVWQRSFRSVPVWGEKAVLTKLEYIHNNPARKGLVQQPSDWPYSSAAAYEGGATPIRIDLLAL